MKKSSKDWMNSMNPNKVMGDAQRMLKSAVDVLEEEIAAGILAAKNLEKKVINVDEIRKENPEELMSRIRRDTHDAIDIILDAVTAIVNQFGNLTDSLSHTKQNGNAAKSADQVSVLRHEGKIKAGESVEIPVLLTNESKDQRREFEFSKADLSGPSGNKILAKNIKLIPGLVLLEPLAKKEVRIKINIPKSCISGIYSGLFQDSKNIDPPTVITIEVE